MCLRSSLSGSAPCTVLLYVLLRDEPQLTPRAIPANAALPASVPRDQGSHASLRSSRRSRDSGLHGGLASMSRTVLYTVHRGTQADAAVYSLDSSPRVQSCSPFCASLRVHIFVGTAGGREILRNLGVRLVRRAFQLLPDFQRVLLLVDSAARQTSKKK